MNNIHGLPSFHARYFYKATPCLTCTSYISKNKSYLQLSVKSSRECKAYIKAPFLHIKLSSL